MNKSFVRLVSAIFFLFLIVLPVFAQENSQPNLSNIQQQSFQKLKDSASNLHVSWEDFSGIPGFISMTNFKIEWVSDDYIERSYQFMEEYKDLFKMADPREEIKLQKKEQDNIGMTHVTFLQEYQSVPVYGGDLKFHFKEDGTLSSFNGHYLPAATSVNINPEIAKEEALATTKDDLIQQLSQEGKSLSANDLENDDPKLLIYTEGLSSQHPSQPQLAWKIHISGKIMIDWNYYIDAHNGNIINKINGVIELSNEQISSQTVDVADDTNININTNTNTNINAASSPVPVVNDNINSVNTSKSISKISYYTMGIMIACFFIIIIMIILLIRSKKKNNS